MQLQIVTNAHCTNSFLGAALCTYPFSSTMGSPEIISRECLRNRRLYTVDFFGSDIFVTVTSTPSVVRKWVSSVMFHRRQSIGRLVVGLGVQWNPFKDFNDDRCGADTLQLCVGSRCLIFQLSLAARAPRILRRFLLDERHTFVGLWNGSDERMLRESNQRLLVHRLIDLRRYVESEVDGESLCRASVERIVEEYLGYEGVRLDKDISMSEWDDVILCGDQVLQACVDARVAFEIGKKLRAWQL